MVSPCFVMYVVPGAGSCGGGTPGVDDPPDSVKLSGPCGGLPENAHAVRTTAASSRVSGCDARYLPSTVPTKLASMPMLPSLPITSVVHSALVLIVPVVLSTVD